MFFEEHAKLLSDFARVSQAAGARADYVQGGGGNTSVKLPGGLMAIKASGFCLSDIRPDKAYAVLDGADLRNFYLTTEPSALADVEKEGSARAKADIRHIDGLADLRPSVEAGFHSILKTFVVHTHSVYATLRPAPQPAVQSRRRRSPEQITPGAGCPTPIPVRI